MICSSIQKFNRPQSESLWSISNFPQRDANNGVSVKETNKLINVENTTTNANSRNIFPIKPPAIAKGTNTTTSTNVIDKAVNPISLLPSNAAVTLSFPISMCRKIFSNTTILSSTKIPTTRDKANKVIKFKENPIRYIKIKVGIMAEGNATNTNIELRKLCKKINMTKATMSTAKNKSCVTAVAASMV